MGEVYRAHDERLERDVAIKVLPPSSFSDATARARLLREARSAAALNHPHICTIYEVGETDGQTYIAMELIEGHSLSSRIEKGALPIEQVIRYGMQLAEALSHAHDRGIVHRDFKSGNVMITHDGRIKVLDFGLAKRVSSDALTDAVTQTQPPTLTQPGTVIGTLAYMAPEQLRGDRGDKRSDIWALGIVLYEMASGSRPFRGQTNLELVSTVLSEPAPPLPAEVPPLLKMVIERCLAKEPDRRYQRAGEVRAALESTQTGAVTPWFPGLSRRSWLAVAAIAAAIVATFAFTAFRNRLSFVSKGPRIQSLAVLPIENVSSNPDQEYFAAGMHDALIGELAKISTLRVISRTSTMQYKGSRKTLPQIAGELNVDSVVEGTVSRSGDNVHLQVQLLQARPEEHHLWAEVYDRRLPEIRTLHGDVARAISEALAVKLTPDESKRLAGSRRVKPEMYEAYIRGMFDLNKATPESVKTGLGYLHQAIESDPADPFAYAGLAIGYTLVGHGPSPPPDAFARAKAAAMRALELDNNLAEAHAALGAIALYQDWDWPASEKELRRALELNPSLAQAHRDYAWFFWLDRRDQAFVEMKRAKEADPLSPLYTAELGWLYWRRGELDRAIQLGQSAAELNPKFPLALFMIGQAYADKGMYDQAITMERKLSEIASPWKFGLALAYAKAGRRDEAQRIATELGRKPIPILGWGLAEVNAVLGNNDEALRWLKYGIDSRFSWVLWVRQNPSYAALRNDSRFQEFMRELKLPPTAPATGASVSR